MKKFIGILVVILIFGIFVFSAYKQRHKPPSASIKDTWQKKGIPVQAEEVFSGDIETTSEVTGSIDALNKVTLSAKIPGRVEAVYAREGDIVNKGQVVIVLEQNDAKNQLQQAEAAYRSAIAGATVTKIQTDAAIEQAKSSVAAAKSQLSVVKQPVRSQERLVAENSTASAKANLDNAEAEFRRAEKLLKQGAISQSMYDVSKTQFVVAQSGYKSAQQQLSLIDEGGRVENIRASQEQVRIAQETLRTAKANAAQNILRAEEVKSARAAVDMAKQNLDNTYIKSSVTGKLSMRLTEPGQVVGTGTPLAQVINMNTLYFQGDQSEKSIAGIKKLQQVQIKIDAMEGKDYSGVVSAIFPSGSTSSRNFPVRISILNSEAEVKPGMFARGIIITGVKKDVMLVSKDAVDDRKGSKIVFTIGTDNKVKRHQIEIVRMDDKNCQIATPNDLKAGDLVVTIGRQNLEDGSLIRIEKAN